MNKSTADNKKAYSLVGLLKVQSLTTQHFLQLKDGSFSRIKSIGNGFYSNGSKLITYTNGLWSCLLNTDQVHAYKKL